MSVTPEEYEEILEAEEWSPPIREALRQQKLAAERRTERLARISEQARADGLVEEWLRASLRELKRVVADCFEVVSWHQRPLVPVMAVEANNKVLPKMRRMSSRLSTVREKSASGCRLHSQWLEAHAELIAEYERYSHEEQPSKITRAAP